MRSGTYTLTPGLYEKQITGSEEARRLFDTNQSLVNWTISNKFGKVRRTALIETKDLIQIGLIGLWKACIHYDPLKSKFSTYAVRCIVSRVARYLRQMNNGRSVHAFFEITEELFVPEKKCKTNRLIGLLPDRYQEIVAMIGSGHSWDDVAKSHGFLHGNSAREALRGAAKMVIEKKNIVNKVK